MNQFFRMDGKVFAVLDKLADLLWLNVLYLICCIPIVTIGTATTSLFYVTLKMCKNEEGYITRSFFHSFKVNFRQSFIIGMSALFIGAVLIVDLYIVLNNNIRFRNLLFILLSMLFLIYVFVMVYVFPLLSKFDNSIKNLVKNSFLISIRHLPWTVLLIGMIAMPFVVSLFVPFIAGGMILIGFSSVAYYTSPIYLRIMSNYMLEKE
ncbi:MAG: YesL family protein [Lachnospiraceae bacterium]|nr:YesL family protein [Lachnospiraceae bacterium]